MSDIDMFSWLFGSEADEVIRWDCIDINAARGIFLPYSNSIIRLLKFTSATTQDKHIDLEQFFCDGRKLSNILCFLSAILHDNETIFNTEVVPLINAELQDWNCYDDPPWVLWKHYLQDILDTLMLWERTMADDRMQCYLYNCLDYLPLT